MYSKLDVVTNAVRPQRIGGAAMWHQGLREAQERADIPLRYHPVVDGSKPRSRGFTTCGATDFYELKAAGRRGQFTKSARTKPAKGGKQKVTAKRSARAAAKWLDFESGWGAGLLDESA